jgi:hypothetical protein
MFILLLSQGLLLEGEDTDTLVKFQNSNLHWVFLVWQEIAFGKHTSKPTHTQFEIKIFTYGKGAAKGVVDGLVSSDAACQAGGLGSIPGHGQTYV